MARPSGKAARTAHRAPRTALRFWLFLLAGIATMSVAGYLVAALYLFPSPLLPNERAVPRLIGLTEREAKRQLERAGFAAADTVDGHPEAVAGIVTWQDPPSGLTAPRGATVRLTVSNGPPPVAVPDVRGMDLAMARLMLEAAGLRVEGVDSVPDKAVLPGIAIGSRPPAGDSVPHGRGVIVQLVR